MPTLTEEQIAVLRKVLGDRTFQSLIGAEEWSLTEDEEMLLWGVVEKFYPTK